MGKSAASVRGSGPSDWADLLRRLSPILLPIIFAACVFGLTMKTYPPFPLVGDQYSYHMTAQRLLERGVYAYGSEDPAADFAPNAGVTPGYTYFLAGVYAVTGIDSDDPVQDALDVTPFVAFGQFILALCTVGLIAGSGMVLGGRRLAILSGLMAALYLPFAWSASMVLGDALGTTLAALQLLLAFVLVGGKSERGYRVAFTYGLVSAALALVRPVFLPWAVLPLLFLALRKRRQWVRWIRVSLVALAGVLVVLAPWTVRNALVVHEFTPLASNSGIVTFLSTGPQTLTSAEQATFDAAVAEGEDGWSAVARQRILAQFRADPVGAIGNRLIPVVNSLRYPWSAPSDMIWALAYQPGTWETATEAQRTTWRDFANGPLTAFKWTHSVTMSYQLALLVSALLGLVFVRRSPRLLLALSVPMYAAGVHAAILAISRYFLPTMPAVIVAASATLYGATRLIARKLGPQD